MGQEDPISFLAKILRVKTLPSGSTRVEFDLIHPAAETIGNIVSCQHQGAELDVTIQVRRIPTLKTEQRQWRDPDPELLGDQDLHER